MKIIPIEIGDSVLCKSPSVPVGRLEGQVISFNKYLALIFTNSLCARPIMAVKRTEIEEVVHSKVQDVIKEQQNSYEIFANNFKNYSSYDEIENRLVNCTKCDYGIMIYESNGHIHCSKCDYEFVI